MKFYREDTRNSNRSTSPTPYLCLRARLCQIVLNETLLLLVFAMILTTLIADVAQGKTSGISISEDGASMKADSDVSYVYAQQTLQSLMGDINATQTSLVKQLQMAQKLQLQAAGKLAKQRKSVAESVASSITRNVTSAIDSLNATLIQKLDAQNEIVEAVKTKLESTVLSVGSSLDLDSLNIDISTFMADVWGILHRLPTSFDTDSYDDTAELEKLSRSLEKTYNSSMGSISGSFIEFRSNITDLVPTEAPAQSANATKHTFSFDESHTEYTKHSPLAVYLCLGLLGILTLPVYFFWDWKCYTYEQKTVKSLAEEISMVADTGALVHRVFDVAVHSVTPWLLSLIRCIWPTFPIDNDVHLCWLGSFLYGWQSRMAGALRIVYIAIVVYCSTGYVMGSAQSSANTTGVVAMHAFEISFQNMTDIQKHANTILSTLDYEVTSELRELQKSVQDILSESIPEMSVDLPTFDPPSLPNITTTLYTQFTASTNTTHSNPGVSSKGVLQVWLGRLKYYIVGVVGLIGLESLFGIALTLYRLRTFQHAQ